MIIPSVLGLHMGTRVFRLIFPGLRCWLSRLCSAAAWLGSSCCGFGARFLIVLNAFLNNPKSLKRPPHILLSRARVPGFAKYSEGKAVVPLQRKLGHEIWVEEIILFRLRKAVPNLSGEVINAQIAMQCMMDVLWINQRT